MLEQVPHHAFELVITVISPALATTITPVPTQALRPELEGLVAASVLLKKPASFFGTARPAAGQALALAADQLLGSQAVFWFLVHKTSAIAGTGSALCGGPSGSIG